MIFTQLEQINESHLPAKLMLQVTQCIQQVHVHMNGH